MRGYPKIRRIDGADYVPREAYDRLRREVDNYARAAKKAALRNDRLKQQIERFKPTSKADSDE